MSEREEECVTGANTGSSTEQRPLLCELEEEA
jgi:hypothetical protein